MNKKTYRDILDSAAGDSLSRNIDVWPGISARLERKSIMNTLRARPIWAMLIALLILLALSGVVYAIERSLGYIPGYGVMDQNVSMRILAEPVSQTRDGITITINEIILTSDKMFLTTTTENIPDNLIVPLSDFTTVTCRGDWIYLLADGTRLSFEPGGGNAVMELFDGSDDTRMSIRGSGYLKFSTLLNVNEITDITLLIPCATSDIPAGSLPENWEFHLHFVPAPAGMMERTAIPVTEFAPSPVPLPTGTAQVNPVSITNVLDIGDSYVLKGECAPPPGSFPDYPGIYLYDGNGQELWWDMPMDIDFTTPTANTPFASAWAIQITKGFVPPLTIKCSVLKRVSFSVPFEFDAGDDPQPGDELQVNQTFEVDGHTFTLEEIHVIAPQVPSSAGGYVFVIRHPDPDLSITPGIEGYPSVNEGFGGGGSGSEEVTQYGVDYSVEFASLPKGKFTIMFTVMVFDGEQAWTVQWQP
jgi:hypothetical protein